jgi:hypothetical protein
LNEIDVASAGGEPYDPAELKKKYGNNQFFTI